MAIVPHLTQQDEALRRARVADQQPIPVPRRDPTSVRAIARTISRPAPAAPASVLRTRLCRAIRADDGHGAVVLAGHLRQATQ